MNYMTNKIVAIQGNHPTNLNPLTDTTIFLANEIQKKNILDKIPMKKLGDSVDIAKAVGFLCSENANYITGQTLHVNGGLALI